jgi:hypothetical protein
MRSQVMRDRVISLLGAAVVVAMVWFFSGPAIN